MADGAPLVTLRLFAAAREAAGTGRDCLVAATVGQALEQAVQRYGPGFADVLGMCRVWVNGSLADEGHELQDGDEVALLPPVSGGCL